MAEALRSGTKLQAMAAADDFLRRIETSGNASKSKAWLFEPASSKQIDQLRAQGAAAMSGLTKYGASCRIHHLWNKRAIWAVLYGIRGGRIAA